MIEWVFWLSRSNRRGGRSEIEEMNRSKVKDSKPKASAGKENVPGHGWMRMTVINNRQGVNYKLYLYCTL